MKNIEQLYETSHDYDRLFNLVEAGNEILCVVNYEFWFDKQLAWKDRDICRAIKNKNTGEIVLSARGCGYVSIFADDPQKKEHFIFFCEKYKVAWIPPKEGTL